MPKSHTISLTGTLQLGRLLQPITISQSQTVPTTGKGHQDAKAAQGTITFYNGLFSSQTVQAGTVLTGADGVQIITDQDAHIPEAYPPSFGYATVSAHVLTKGLTGNISAYDINEACCATAIKAVNTTAFHGGQDERKFQTVAKSDIDNIASTLKATISASMHGALATERKEHETVITLPCSPTITPNHRIGDEATQVKVTVSVTCSGIAYETNLLETRATQLLTSQAAQTLGTGYSRQGSLQITVTSATAAEQVRLSFTSVGTWIYALSSAEQKHIKKIIAGKNKQEAMQLLNSLPGIEHVSLRLSGFGDDTRIPKNLSNIHLALMYGL